MKAQQLPLVAGFDQLVDETDNAWVCLSAPQKHDGVGFFGMRNDGEHGITVVVDDGTEAVLPPGYTAEQGKIGTRFRLPSGRCVTYPSVPGYIVLQSIKNQKSVSPVKAF